MVGVGGEDGPLLSSAVKDILLHAACKNQLGLMFTKAEHTVGGH